MKINALFRFATLAGTQQLTDNVSVNNITSNSAEVSWDGSGADKCLVLFL